MRFFKGNLESFVFIFRFLLFGFFFVLDVGGGEDIVGRGLVIIWELKR